MIGIPQGPSDHAAEYSSALTALESMNDVRLIVLPGQTSVQLQQVAIDHCERMSDRFAILDSAAGEDSQDIIDRKAKLRSPHGFAAMYSPWLKVADSNSNKAITVPSSGAIAGIYAFNDSSRGVHKAPANMAITGIIGLEREMTSQEISTLSSSGIDLIRKMPGRGILVWGARTVSDDPEWKYVNVRRLVNYLETSIAIGTAWTAFEANDQKLWAKLVQSAGEFLTRCWIDGMLLGARSAEAFFVKCDRSTMTQDDIDAGRVILIIGIAATRPAEFIVFRVSHRTSGT